MFGLQQRMCPKNFKTNENLSSVLPPDFNPELSSRLKSNLHLKFVLFNVRSSHLDQESDTHEHKLFKKVNFTVKTWKRIKSLLAFFCCFFSIFEKTWNQISIIWSTENILNDIETLEINPFSVTVALVFL